MHLVDASAAGEMPSDVGTEESDTDVLCSVYGPVYVSAVEHPEHFWVQMLSKRSTQLDSLINEMTSFYETQV